MYRTVAICALVAIVTVIVLVLAIPPSRRWFLKCCQKFNLIREYFECFAGAFADIAFGVVVIGAVWAVPFLAWAIASQFTTIPAWLNWTALIAAFFITGYYIWRVDHVRLIPKLAVRTLQHNPMHNHPRGGSARYFRFFVENLSEGSSVKDIRVELARISPPISKFNTRLPLFQTNDNPPPGALPSSRKISFDLHPEGEQGIDLVSAVDREDYFDVRHTIEGLSQDAPCGTYRLTVKILAEQTRPLTVCFRVEKQPGQALRCEIEA